jgi:fatty acid desaturase
MAASCHAPFGGPLMRGLVSEGSRSASPMARHYEMPTLILALIIHGGWLALTWWHALLGPWALAVAGGWVIAWHGSLQHETIHGHPTPHHWLNTLIGGVPLALWLPYAIYRRTHLAHHDSPAITDPFDDPESRYLTGRAHRGAILLGGLEASLLGRLLIGPLLIVGRFLGNEMLRVRRQPAATARDWIVHLCAVAAILSWLRLCGISPGRYLLLFVYPGTALTLLRSFAEHRAGREPDHRVAIVEDRGPLALLFLNNNLHATHHRAPGLSWYELPDFHRRHRAAIVAGNGGLLYRNFAEVARRYLLRPHDALVHPDHV